MNSINIRKPLGQFIILVRHFVIRLFNNDLMEYENEKRERVIFILAILSVLGGFIARQLLSPYLYPDISGASPVDIWREKATFLTLTMTLTGIFSVLNWDNIFPDRTDYLNLTPLPISMRRLYFAKFASILVFVGILSFAFNVFALLIFTFFLGKVEPVGLFYLGFSHMVTNFLANLFIFFAVAALQSIFTLICRTPRMRKLSGFVQVVLLLGFTSVFVWFPMIYSHLPRMKAGFSAFLEYFPPLWFTGLYEWMLGGRAYEFTFSPYLGIWLMLGCALVYLSSFSFAFKRVLYTSGAGRVKVGLSRVGEAFKRGLHRVFLRHPVQRAVFYFVLQTLKRSRKHRLQLVMYLALPFSYVVTQVIYFNWNIGAEFFLKPGNFLVSIPLVFYYSLAVGLRMLVRHPANLGANWVFRTTEQREKRHFIIGLKKALLVLWAPVFVGVFVFYFYCWGFRLALYHSFFSAAVYFLLLELVFMKYNQIPFTAAYNPGKFDPKWFWFIYIIGFLQYLVTFSNMGMYLLGDPGLYLYFYLGVMVMYAAMVSRRRLVYGRPDFRFAFNEDPEPLMLSLGT